MTNGVSLGEENVCNSFFSDIPTYSTPLGIEYGTGSQTVSQNEGDDFWLVGIDRQ